jgi:hypothetical protein
MDCTVRGGLAAGPEKQGVQFTTTWGPGSRSSCTTSLNYMVWVVLGGWTVYIARRYPSYGTKRAQ